MVVLDSVLIKMTHDSRDWAMTMVLNPLQNTWRSNVLTEVVARVCGQSEVAINK